jgi:eukaryotic-like serine/threonine-protein kinase
VGHEVGDLIDERYKLLEVIGTGGQGVVYRAEDLELGANVAIKCLHPEVTSEPVFKTRMQREARAMGALSGTSAVQVFAYNKLGDGTLYIVMELLQGQNFELYLRGIEEQGGQLAAAKLFELLTPIAETLHAAHARGIIHRDIKPANIFVLNTKARGGVRLLDFGLVKDLNADPLTKEGSIPGSPSYIAPEVWKGVPKELDHRIDVYSFGAVVFRALSGRLPFVGGKLAQILIAVTRGARPSLFALRPDLPQAVDGWVQKALAASKDERFQTIDALWRGLSVALGFPETGVT